MRFGEGLLTLQSWVQWDGGDGGGVVKGVRVVCREGGYCRRVGEGVY